MNIKLLLFAFFAFFVLPYGSFAACSFAVNGTTNTVSSSCSFDNTNDGLDAGTTAVINGQTVPVNTSILKISGGTVTIGATQQIAVGSMNLTGGSLAIIAGGKMLLNTPIWYTDPDNDGAYDPVFTFSKTQPTYAIRKNTANPSTFDCNTSSAAVGKPHAQCYGDADGDAYTNGLAANTTCLNVAATTCASATAASASTNGAAVTNYTAGRLRDAANGADCNDGSTSVFTAHAQCYSDADGDTYTTAAAANTTCLNTASCATATQASTSTNGAATTAYTAGRLRDAATTVDCGASDPNAYPGSGYYGGVTFTNTSGGSGWDYNCNSVVTYQIPASYVCNVAGCASHYFTISNGWAGAVAACGTTATYNTYAGAVAGACTTYTGGGVTCPAVTTSTPLQLCN